MYRYVLKCNQFAQLIGGTEASLNQIMLLAVEVNLIIKKIIFKREEQEYISRKQTHKSLCKGCSIKPI